MGGTLRRRPGCEQVLEVWAPPPLSPAQHVLTASTLRMALAQERIKILHFPCCQLSELVAEVRTGPEEGSAATAEGGRRREPS